MILFYDFEIFKFDWLVVIINPHEKQITTIVNNSDELKAYYEEHKNQIWVGYNSRHYDQYILKGILCGFNPKEINDFIILEKNGGWAFSRLFPKIKLYNYDVAKLNDGGLKTLESYMGNDIQETSVPFDIDRKLTENELQETISYCAHDVEQTIEVFLKRKKDFDAHMNLIKTFNLPMSCISKTQAQLSAQILNCVKQDRDDEWDITIVPTLKLKKYRYVLEWFKSHKDYSSSLIYDIAGVEHSFGWGGVHGAKKQYHSKGLIIHVDVNSYYPSLMIKYNFITRNSKTPEKYKQIYDTRLALKKAGKKAEQAPYKIVLNGTYGISKDKYSSAYDPRQANNICINGQLLLIDLIEKLEEIPGFELIQSNTDGLIIKIPDTDDAFNAVDDICYEWEKRTGMGLGFDTITEIWQKDVNNYIFRFDNGKLERKGAWVQEYNPLKNDFTVVNEAVVEYLTNGIPIEDYINSCNDLNKFQKVVKISNKYLCGWHNGKKLSDKTFRVFASIDPGDGSIYKQKAEGATLEKFANTPEKCRILNTKITDKMPEWLDRDYYIQTAKERARCYGVDVV